MKKVFSSNNINYTLVFLFLISIYFISSFILNNLIFDNKLLFNELEGKIPLNVLSKQIYFLEKLSIYSYLFVFVITSLKIFIISFSIKANSLFRNINISFRKIIKPVIIADLIFAISELIRVIILDLNSESITFREIFIFYPTSIISFFDNLTYSDWYINLLKSINIEQVLFIITCAFFLNRLTDIEPKKCFGLVLVPYIFLFFIFQTFIIVLSLYYFL
jgi:hypothetical protein